MKKLGKRNYELISDSMNALGFDSPQDALMNEEQMYVSEIGEILEFLKWLHKIDRPFGRANYEQRFAEFKRGDKPPVSFYQVVVNFPGVPPTNMVSPKGIKLYFPDHQHIKRISGNHEDMIQITARLCSNLDSPNWMKVVEINNETGEPGMYEKFYDLDEMKKFIEANKEEIQKIRLEGYDKYPSEFL